MGSLHHLSPRVASAWMCTLACLYAPDVEREGSVGLPVVHAPGWDSAVVTDTNARGTLIGYVTHEATGERRGFYKTREGPAVLFSYPGATVTEPRSIDERGEIVGAYGPRRARKTFCFDGMVFLTLPTPFPRTIAGSSRGARGGDVLRKRRPCAAAAPGTVRVTLVPASHREEMKGPRPPRGAPCLPRLPDRPRPL